MSNQHQTDEPDERWQPMPVPLGDGRHDIGDDARAAIFHRLHDDFTLAAPWMTAEQRRRLAMFAAASVRALLHELGTLRDLTGESQLSAQDEEIRTLRASESPHAILALESAATLPPEAMLVRADVIERRGGYCESQWLRTIAHQILGTHRAEAQATDAEPRTERCHAPRLLRAARDTIRAQQAEIQKLQGLLGNSAGGDSGR